MLKRTPKYVCLFCVDKIIKVKEYKRILRRTVNYFSLFCVSAGQVADPNATLSDHLLVAVLNLLKKEVSEHGRHLTQYFHLFLMYSNLGIPEVSCRISVYEDIISGLVGKMRDSEHSIFSSSFWVLISRLALPLWNATMI